MLLAHFVARRQASASRARGGSVMQSQVKIGRLILVFILGALFWFIPAPAGVSDQGIHLLGIFLATIVGIVCKALPMGAVALFGLTATVLTQTLNFETAFSGFKHPVVWLIVAAFFLARGFGKTGLGNRVAYLFVGLLGRRTLGLSYGLMVTEFILAPAIPSNTARAGGVILPILESLSRSFGSDPALGTARRMGAFLTVVAFQGTAVTSAMFLTSMATNPLLASFSAAQGASLTWGAWAIAAIVPGVVVLALLPLIIYVLYPPGVKTTPDAPRFAAEKLAEMGKMKQSEWIMLGTFILLIVLWILGPQLKLDATVTALIGLCILILLEVLSWKDILQEQGAWETLFWFAALIAMAGSLDQLGVVPWVGLQLTSVVQDFTWPMALVLLALFYYYSHYFFASLLAHAVSMFPVFLSVAVAMGAPPMMAALLLSFITSLMGGLTHYASGPAALLYGAGYVPLGRWWQIGLIMSIVNVIIWFGIGSIWWRILGLW
jgi:divalent anion:Na+ symporter, DASS family